MSGTGGFYKYRCKYFYTHNCPNWVYCNGHACAMCLAEGREAADTEPAASAHAQGPSAWQRPHQHQQHPPTLAEICVPQAIHGTLCYTIMEIIPTDDSSPGAYWVLRQKAMEPRALPYSNITTSDTPRPVMAAAAMPMQMTY
ncbi:7e952ef6-2c31-4e97-8e91-ab519b523fa0 [Thermothielavioides terrestris]|uniref:Uncharacterized protein n=2 Tax=Thermothielavioides terrestris TaxID=2587410 RepID=G2RID6_THETT|nr:uncharacterized protein THITE_2124184 [Thermothielavioides terrestris NRRL 8126]AEO71598.1 hypothetical protein THITE_2124184 [Thermothielavioides terrestris NRRL 8126]SPQ27416.1 7e952ef6-2c31-4e97-8e91-ab519b523fa0 [Thermothielavioides terrestris]